MNPFFHNEIRTMVTKPRGFFTPAFAILLSWVMASNAPAQVDARLSAREAWVGVPIVLQISISNASDFDPPVLPELDGCDVRAAGSPSQSSQITIINGRRSESRSVTMQYLITPRREGTFEIPSLTVNVDGRDQQTRPLRFVATRSETGDLLFVEIEGGKDRVFVGQPLDLTLKIWIKPFVDRENNIKLSEGNMWQMISEQTSWGSFADRLKELAAENQRPGGQEVLRVDGNGSEREYYLYEIDATVYPKRAGRIDADDVQIVVNYPTALGKSRDPFESLFEDSPFGGSSPLSRMINDEFFRGSPFGNRLSVTESRPVVGVATVDSTLVVDVPATGRPADYRGAVGKYRIITQASPTAVSAGDPITLNIGIIGTGPMELVQAPPLSQIPSLTADFKVADQSLAGFVEDDTKVFPTTIRPRKEGITQIPAIPFSFFDPDSETFQTMMSEPISISVSKSESLSLDAIVGSSGSRQSDNEESASHFSIGPDFTNDHSSNILVSQPPADASQWWWGFVAVPPFIWLITVSLSHRRQLVGWLPNFRSARAQCLAAIDRARDQGQVEIALIQYISRRTGQSASNAQTAVGTLRTIGLNSVACEIESFFQRCEHSAFAGAVQHSPAELKQNARKLVGQLELALASTSKSQVRIAKQRRGKLVSTTETGDRRGASPAHRITRMLLAVLLAFAATPALEKTARAENPSNDKTVSVKLSKSQQRTILEEAGEVYSKAMSLAKSDSAEANDLFMTAISKYQLLADSGIQNGGLYMNLGNACLQSNQVGLAIAWYERARLIDPGNRQLAQNLELANALVKKVGTDGSNGVASAGATSVRSVINRLRNANDSVVSLVGLQSMIWILAICSLVFWGIFIARAAGLRLISRYWALLPMLLLLLSLGSVTLGTTTDNNERDGILITSNVTLYSGDGEEFDVVESFDEAQGNRVQVLTSRGNWVQVKTPRGKVGWLHDQSIIQLN